ncbi:3'-5' exonuclease [Tumebacillus permanentifrigoris]|uniref:Superfamily I DNA and RNA helicase n=1 Tax=Tumebacillus permanentifrigoris TaxID=378543 RepID=A0A316DIK4_9BACL|nr:nuclease-related domain-containing DEAD/DEAH box helicase [Tumebacillus permanentifrigoris]PWK16463.1 superfamily I DNA and RNA helicase [Tumebacillus permanentifrigoris]
MAFMIPETIHSSATAGERLFFQTLKRDLPEDYLVYYEPDIKGKRPDFVIIGPDLGILVLEVKDYTKNTLHQLNRDDWTIKTSAGDIQTVKSPLLQARQYAFHLCDLLKRDKNLVQLAGKYHGSLKFPYGYGTVFTRLKQEEFIRHDLYSVIEPNLVLCRDEIDSDEEGYSQEHLVEKLQGMMPVFYRRSERLSDAEIQAIRYHLFPEVRISAEFGEPVPYQDQLLLSLHNIKTMDLYQENLAKQMGDKHRLIRGVAGSGKTLILASRAKLLSKEHPDWKILILCYGVPLARQLHSLIEQRDKSDLNSYVNIQVYNFHAWLRDTFRIVNDDQIPLLLDKIEKKEAILPKYEAILIDEGQDFAPEWLKLVSSVLSEETQSLLLVEDRAQNIFKRKTSLNQNIGLDFRGRSKVLTINYRNTAQVVQFAWDFYQKHSVLQNKVKQGTTEGVEILPPQSTKRRGPEPMVKRFANLREEMSLVCAKVYELYHEGIPLSEMAILYRIKNSYREPYIDTIRQQLSNSNIPFYWVTENAASKRQFNRKDESVKISTFDSVKGLDFRVVFIVNLESMPFKMEENEERDVALLYIGMTRSLQYLFLTYSGNSLFTRYLDEVELRRQQGTILEQARDQA